MSNSALAGNLFGTFINWLYSTGAIKVPSDFHGRCGEVQQMIDMDCSGVINPLLNYSIQSASEAKYRVECSEPTLQKILNMWLQEINISVKGIPTGLTALSKEYFKERWQGSSFCGLNAGGWKKIEVGGTSISVPTVMWFTNGSSLYVKRTSKENYVLGSDKYFLDKEFKNELKSNKEIYVAIQKPFSRWFDEYPSPYLVKNGVLKNFLALKTLQGKSDETISKALPYLFMMVKGLPEIFLKGTDYNDTELKEMVNNFKSEMEKYKSETGKIPAHGVPFDQKYEHLIPDLLPMVKEELYRQGFRNILSGMGFIDVIQGVSSTRKESVLNPKPFISEINAGVDDFKTMLLDVIYQIIERNKGSHKKMFSDRGKILIVNSPLKINIENILEDLRAGYDRGPVSATTYQTILGLDPETEKMNIERELRDGLEDLLYPHLIQNREDVPDRMSPTKPRNEKLENQGKNPGSPESKKFKNASEENRVIAPCKKCNALVGWIYLPENGMGYVNCPLCGEPNTQKDNEEMNSRVSVAKETTQENLETAPYKDLSEIPSYIKKMTVQCQETFMETFNDIYNESNDESKAMAIGISAAKRCMKKLGYIYNKDTKSWEKNNG